MAEHSGFEQTNGRAVDTLENFEAIAKVCVGAYDSSHPIHEEVKTKFALYEDVAKKLHLLALSMKSQKKVDSDEFDDKLLDVILAWDKAFPGRQYFNKLHVVMMHLPEFVAEYGICGRASAESHESVHAMMAKAKAAVSRMSSTKRKFKTLYARATVNLKEGIVEFKTKIQKKMTGKKRGKYNTTKDTKRQDQVEFFSSVFKGTEQVGNEEFVRLVGGGRIHNKYKDLYLYVKTGRAPDNWANSFVQSQLLSAAKVEQAKHATH